MDKKTSSPAPNPAAARETKELPAIEPLTRRGYKRRPETERQIGEALSLDAAALIARALQRDEDAPDFLSAESLVYFIRRADRNGDRKTRDGLFRELFERCIPFFHGNLSVVREIGTDGRLI